MPIARWERAAIALLLLTCFVALAGEAWMLGPTVDEPSHLISAYLWWHTRDRLYPRDMPPLIKIVGGWPSALTGLPVPGDVGQPGDRRTEWEQAAQMFTRLPLNRIQPVLFWSRLPLTVFPLLTILLLWWWGRQLFGPVPAVVAACFWAACPTALGHGALFKYDLAATFTHLLFWYSAWRFWRLPSLLNAAALGAAAALALLSKMSLAVLLAFVPVILTARAVPAARNRWRQLGLHFITCGAVLYLMLASAWQFEMYRPTPDEILKMTSDPKVPAWIAGAAKVARVLPVPAGAWTGAVSLLQSNAAAVPVYMLGQVYPEGHRLYFVLSTILKLSLPVQLIAVLGVVLLVRHRLHPADVFWLLPGPLYFALASLSSLHLGVRLVLPAWIFLFLLLGLPVRWLLLSVQRRCALGAALLAAVLLSVRAYPYGISYFNPFAGKPQDALRYLADSNIDWGQGMPALCRYVEKHRIAQLHLAYFGFDRPERCLKTGQWTALVPPWSGDSPTERFVPEPGWYAISASLLPGQFFLSKYRDFFGEFTRRRPVAVAGGSIFIYRID